MLELNASMGSTMLLMPSLVFVISVMFVLLLPLMMLSSPIKRLSRETAVALFFMLRIDSKKSVVVRAVVFGL